LIIVQHAIQLLKAETEMAMRLIGAPTLKDIVPEMVDTRSLFTHSNSVPENTGSAIYQRLDSAVGSVGEAARVGEVVQQVKASL
jgi:L-lactate dehydrogenase (cytochrome)